MRNQTARSQTSHTTACLALQTQALASNSISRALTAQVFAFKPEVLGAEQARFRIITFDFSGVSHLSECLL